MSQRREVLVRRAAADEAEEAARLMIAARHAAVPAIPPLTHSDAEVLTWFCDHVMVEMEVWVAHNGSAIVAVMVLSDSWIEQLYVDPRETNRGYGSTLVRYAQSLATGPIELWTFVSNTGAQRFYERHGFAEMDRTDGDNEEGQPDIRYRWPKQERSTTQQRVTR